jgi:hypothetical protein
VDVHTLLRHEPAPSRDSGSEVGAQRLHWIGSGRHDVDRTPLHRSRRFAVLDDAGLTPSLRLSRTTEPRNRVCQRKAAWDQESPGTSGADNDCGVVPHLSACEVISLCFSCAPSSGSER